MKRLLLQLLAVAGAFTATASYVDDYISTEATPTVIDLGGDLVYVFSNKSDVGVARTVTAQKAFTLKEALLVGGGGGGGQVMGGGGGGGQVLSLNAGTGIAASATIELTVPAGGATASGMNSGKNGGHAMLLLPGSSVVYAYGGGGGGAWSENGNGRPAAVTGEIGSGGGAKYNTYNFPNA